MLIDIQMSPSFKNHFRIPGGTSSLKILNPFWYARYFFYYLQVLALNSEQMAFAGIIFANNNIQAIGKLELVFTKKRKIFLTKSFYSHL